MNIAMKKENLNYHMCNQRSGVFTLNYLTDDTIYHSRFQNWYLEEIHDIRTTNIKTKDIHNVLQNFKKKLVMLKTMVISMVI